MKRKEGETKTKEANAGESVKALLRATSGPVQVDRRKEEANVNRVAET